jgi:hypothetical protein
MPHQVVWFDVPVRNLDRAIQFYSRILAREVKKETEGMEIGVFSHSGDDVAGCLVRSDNEEPSDRGPLLYFNVAGRLDEALTLVAECGGRVLLPKHSIGPHGYRAIVIDSEGNRIALHSE